MVSPFGAMQEPVEGATMQETIHHMGRRCRDWDYGARAIYMVAVSLKERGRPVLAQTPVFKAHFQAIGNIGLLQWPVMLPVQCSRRDFAYRRERLATGGWKILRNAAGEPLVEYSSPDFEEKSEDALSCAQKGAVLVNPCISHGEREIARRAHAVGARVIALRNKGFAPRKASRMARSCVAGMRKTAASADGGMQCARSRIAASAVVRAELGFGIIYT